MPFIELQSVDSTNNYALAQVHAGLAQHGTGIFAREQVAGKGQRGKTWIAEKGANILLSVVVNPYPLLISQQFQLSVCAAIAVQEFFMKYAGTDTKIKWPNDLYWQDRKAGGILIESGVRRKESEVQSRESGVGNSELWMERVPIANHELQNVDWRWAVIGIGININQSSFPPELTNPVSLKQITGREFDTLSMAQELHSLFMERFEELIHGDFDSPYKKYLSVLYKNGEMVKLKKGNRVFEARIKTILPAGQLIVQHSIEEEFNFGDIEWLINSKF